MDAPPPTADAEILSEETVHHGRFPKQLVRFRYRRFDGAMSRSMTWEVWRRGAAVAVLPYDAAADRVVLIEQFRLPARLAGITPILLEVPAGLLDGDSPGACARREMIEETGLAVGRMERLGHYLLTPGGSDETIHIFAAEIEAPATDDDGIAGHFGLPEENEDIRVRVFDAADAIAAAFDGRVRNATTAIALAWLGLNRDRLRRAWSAR
jgi:ADP-ribose pyrophosphatase